MLKKLQVNPGSFFFGLFNQPNLFKYLEKGLIERLWCMRGKPFARLSGFT
ncbi:hypothetical protein Psch_03924 [Pelotomaculum schinkii]|uniref:Uncharacterized protein n=1 Tax=Pelotomaculum schinkii TaxID=78350 RepID=A0A4Y7R659_9FIRM|nr:hypothetical protein Psch_03924 [Pelotomaculum schinkii]TEB17775.1 hypothetical protein Psfp_00267 [Pelotomaculum sp. FP]